MKDMGSIRPDLGGRVHPEAFDQTDRLPDSLILLIFNKIGDVKALGKCCVVSKRFHSLVPQVDNVVVRVDCVISDEGLTATSTSGNIAFVRKPRSPISSILRIFSAFLKPFQSLSQFISPTPRRVTLSADFDLDSDQSNVTHHSPTQVLKNFKEIKILRIELPGGELGLDEGILLRWKANFGSTLDNCAILGASSVVQNVKNCEGDAVNHDDSSNTATGSGETENESIPENFYTHGGLKLRVVWTISSLIAASARHYLLQPIIEAHKTMESLILTDLDGQGVLAMDKEQLEELRLKPLSASSTSKRTLVPALNMRLWYAQQLQLPNGMILNGATLVAVRPSDQTPKELVGSDSSWIASSFEEPYETAARMLLSRRTYCLEMNSF